MKYIKDWNWEALDILISAKEVENHLVSFTPIPSNRKLQNNSGFKWLKWKLSAVETPMIL